MERKISIHALREEGDKDLVHSHRSFTYFYPRPPRGGRLLNIGEFPNAERISIHALREEGDDKGNSSHGLEKTFLSTPSARRATFSDFAHGDKALLISIHALREEGDPLSGFTGYSSYISIHALREEGDTSRWARR